MNHKRLKLVSILGHWRWFFFNVILPCWKTRLRTPKVLSRVRKKAQEEKLNVLFVVGSLAKWKCQSLFDMMAKSDKFEPIIALIICDVDLTLDEESRLKEIERRRQYFTSRGMRCVTAYLPKEGNIALARFKPDLVFYSQPWGVEDAVSTYETSKMALTFYVQYYITLCETESSVNFASSSPFYRHLYTYFAQTPHLAALYCRNQGCFTATHEFIGLGHPMLDQFKPDSGLLKTTRNNYVIYAPHWTITYPGSKNYDDCSTFFDTGESILEYARQHLEFKWVFKPHPALRVELEKSGIWTHERINKYYEEWERIGIYSRGNYVEYFNDSRALITDSLSFLYEYVCTGRPIIRLLHNGQKLDLPGTACARLFNSYYLAYTKEEMLMHFTTILEKENDPNRVQRLAIASELGLFGENAGRKIYDYLVRVVDGKKEVCV